MRKIVLLLGIICCWGFTVPEASSGKKAMIIAIGNYPEDSGWNTINSANDIPLVKGALLRQGFQENDIVIIQDEAATRTGIINGIQHWVQQLQPGDMVYFHYSGHGQQVADNNGDELDGFDESIVPVNSPMSYKAGIYEGQNLIRDEELGELFAQVRKKITAKGNLLVVMDACHSGTGTRGFGTARGTSTKMASKQYIKANASNTNKDPLFSLKSRSASQETALAPMVAFFGASAGQLNYETLNEAGQPVGSLSYAFSKKFSFARKDFSYRRLFEQIKLEMSAIAPRQQPLAEGMLDQQILGGKLLGNPLYYKAERWSDAHHILINAGWIQGLHKGSVVGIYPADTRNYRTTVPITKGTVTYSSFLTSKITLEKPLPKDEAFQSWIYVLEQNLGPIQVKLSIDLEDSNFTRELVAALREVPVIHLMKNAELSLTQIDSKITLKCRDGYTLANWPSTYTAPILKRKLLPVLSGFLQSKYLKNLEHDAPGMQVRFEIIPLAYDSQTKEVTGEIPLYEKMDATGNLRLKNGDVFKIKILNEGQRPAYFTLVDFMPDNQMNVLIPGERETSEEFKIMPMQQLVIPKLWQIGPPAGTEVFKLFATEAPIDLRPVIRTRGSSTRGRNGNPLEQLVGQTFLNQEWLARGGKTINVASDGLQVTSLTFIIEQ